MIIKPSEVILECNTFDKEHITLVNLVNGVYKLLRENRKNLAVEVFYDGLVAYTNAHLRHEEELMSMYKYPELDVHVKTHEVFRKVIAEDLANFDDLKGFVSNLGLSMSWIFNHIRKTDRKYVEYYKRIGVYNEACSVESVTIDKSLEDFLKELLEEDFITAEGGL